VNGGLGNAPETPPRVGEFCVAEFVVRWHCKHVVGTRRRLVATRALRINYGQARSYIFCCDAAGHI